MLVCHCLGVSDRAVRRAVREGAATLADVSSACGAGSCCGGCHQSLRELIRSEAAQREPQSAATGASSIPAT